MTFALPAQLPQRRDGRFSLGWAIPLDVAGAIGMLEPRRRADGRITSWRVIVRAAGQRYLIGAVPMGSRWVPLKTRAMAELVLGEIRAEASKSGSLERALAPYLRRPDASMRCARWLARFLSHEAERCECGDISPRTLGELRRYAREDGELAYWSEVPIFGVTYGALEDWRSWLAKRGLGAKTVRNVMGEFRRFLRWLHRRGEIDAVPDFPPVPYDRKAPEILTMAEQAAVLAAIPWERRGLFLAMAHTLRPGEARAADLFHWSEPDLLVQQAAKGNAADAPIRGLKERDWRVVGASEELAAWISWRLEEASPEEKLRRLGVPLFPSWQRANRTWDGARRWSYWALRDAWKVASAKASVRYVSPYPATKHATATDLVRRGVDAKTLQRFLGHADPRSTDHYVVLGAADVKDLVRGRKP